jgi:hypothetical protein
VNAQVPGPPTVTSSPILKVISPASTQANLVAVVVQMEEACGTGGQGFREHHDALTGLATDQLQCKATTGCRPAGTTKPFVGVLPCGGMRINVGGPSTSALFGRAHPRCWLHRRHTPNVHILAPPLNIQVG